MSRFEGDEIVARRVGALAMAFYASPACAERAAQETSGWSQPLRIRLICQSSNGCGRRSRMQWSVSLEQPGSTGTRGPGRCWSGSLGSLQSGRGTRSGAREPTNTSVGAGHMAWDACGLATHAQNTRGDRGGGRSAQTRRTNSRSGRLTARAHARRLDHQAYGGPCDRAMLS